MPQLVVNIEVTLINKDCRNTKNNRFNPPAPHLDTIPELQDYQEPASAGKNAARSIFKPLAIIA